MSGDGQATDLGAEREIDLLGWLNAALAYWWLAVAGLAVGVAAGTLVTLGGTTKYTATALIARGQAFNPSGSGTVLSYLSNLAAIQNYVSSPSALDAAAAKAGMTAGELRGHVAAATLTGTGEPSTTNTGSILVAITVTLAKPKKAEDAANELARIVAKATTSTYVEQSIKLYQVRLKNYATRLKSLAARIQSLNDALANTSSLQLTDRLLLLTQLDQAEATQGQTLDSQTTVQQQLTLAEDVEKTQIVQNAEVEKVPPGRSRRNAVLVGGLIGLILGAVAATVYGQLRRRARTA
jgi:uncharacterized protein involved in exopolysaccharide biosynthesis